MENHKKSQNGWSPGRDLDMGPPEYEAEVLITWLLCSVKSNVHLESICKHFQVLDCYTPYLEFKLIFNNASMFCETYSLYENGAMGWEPLPHT